MSIRIALTIGLVLLLSGFRIVSQDELEALKSPVNPHLQQVSTLYHDRIVPGVIQQAKPLSELFGQMKTYGDFEQACQTLGYRAQSDSPCHFSTSVQGKIVGINTQSRTGKITLQPEDNTLPTVEVQIGPVLRGTVLRDNYRDLHYSDFNDQTLFGDFGKAINQAAVDELKQFQPQENATVTVYGVFSSWDLPGGKLLITPVRIESQP